MDFPNNPPVSPLSPQSSTCLYDGLSQSSNHALPCHIHSISLHNSRSSPFHNPVHPRRSASDRNVAIDFTRHEEPSLVRDQTTAMQNEHHLSEPARKRLRTSHACDLCRGRKIRCDGNTPCAACLATDNACSYGSEANSRGKSELILEGVLRVEKMLHEMSAGLTSSPYSESSRQLVFSPIVGSQTSRGSFSGSPLAELHFSPRNRQRTPHADPETPNNLENAVLETWHTSTTESVLQWPHFDTFPSLRHDYVSIFQLEQSRPPVHTKPATTIPYLTPEEVGSVLDAFSHAINFWYPTTSLDQIKTTRSIILSGDFDSTSPDTVLALLIMSLGCASQVVANLTTPSSSQSTPQKCHIRKLGNMYFTLVLSKLHTAHTSITSTATHCLFFVAIYFAYLRRPLQAWEYISAAAAKCMLLISYPPTTETPSDQERIRRIFWSCYILESDYLAELSSLPLSGIARIESSIPLPGATTGVVYPTHDTPQEEELSSLYFLACISMRRLLNRVHQLLYARGTGASLDNARFPYVVAELDHQLEEWRDVLPAAFAFTVGFEYEGAKTEHGGFLRQRYLTCRSVIYRPYLMWMLRGQGHGRGSPPPIPANMGSSTSPSDTASATAGENINTRASTVMCNSPDVLRNCKACLDACLLHILNLRGFAQTVMVDTWICSLSMAGAMLVLLAAVRIPSLRNLIGPEVLAAGDHLRQLLEGWQKVLGEPSSPSVDQSVKIIGKADRFIREVYGASQGVNTDGVGGSTTGGIGDKWK